jgi:hypothetical protein
MGCCLNKHINNDIKEEIKQEIKEESKNEIAIIIYIKDCIHNNYLNSSVEMFSIPFKNLKLFDSIQINNHNGIGPIHFYYINDLETIETQNNIKKYYGFQKTSKKIIFKLKQLIRKKEIKYFFKDNFDYIYIINDIFKNDEIKKIIFIHET